MRFDSARRLLKVRSDMPCEHLNPEKWVRGSASNDGRVPTYCPGCQKFMGYVVPVEKKEKGGK